MTRLTHAATLVAVAGLPGCMAAGWIGTLMTLAGGVFLLVSVVQAIVAASGRRPARAPGLRALAAVAIVVAGFTTIAVGLSDEDRAELDRDSERRRAEKAKKQAESSPASPPPAPAERDLSAVAPSVPRSTAEATKLEPANDRDAVPVKPSEDLISAELFCARLEALIELGGGKGMRPGACAEGKKPEENTSEFQKLARCLFDMNNIDEYRSRCVVAE